MSVILFDVTDIDYDFFDGDAGSVLYSMVLSVLSEKIDEIVSIG